MKFREIFRFEFMYQARAVRTWLYFAVLFFVAFQLRWTAGDGSAHIVSAYDIALETLLAGLLWILTAPAVAGSAAARDVQTRMHPLIYAAPISKSDYLGGRFLAALLLNALILLAVPLGALAALFLTVVNHGDVRVPGPVVYLTSYGVLLLPTAFTFTAVQFSVATLKRRAIVAYPGTVLFILIATIPAAVVTNVLQMPAVGKLLDPSCRLNVQIIMGDTLTPLEKNTLVVGLDSSILANRLLWLCVASAILVFTHNRFRPGDREG